MIDIVLPFPPTVNHYLVKSVRRRKGKHYVHVAVSAKGVNYRAAVLTAVLKRQLMHHCDGYRLDVEVHLFPPDKRKRDLDNYPKVLLDSLTSARLWEDDEQIDKLTIIRREVQKPEGLCVVRVKPFNAWSDSDPIQA